MTARVAGLWFLILVICGVYAHFGVRGGMIVWGDAGATVDNISADKFTFRTGIIADLLMTACFLMYGLTMYGLLKPVHKMGARMMLLSIVISVAMMGINMLNQVAMLVVLNGAEYWSAFTSDQLNAFVMLFAEMHGFGYMLSMMYFGLYMLPLGYLIYRSRLFPKVFGIVLMLGFLGDFVELIRYFIYPEWHNVLLDNITLPADIGELTFCLWLLIMGANRKFSNKIVTDN